MVEMSSGDGEWRLVMGMKKRRVFWLAFHSKTGAGMIGN